MSLLHLQPSPLCPRPSVRFRKTPEQEAAAVAMATARACSPWLLEVEVRWLLTHRGRKLGLLGRVSGLRVVAVPTLLGSSEASLLRDKALFRLDFSWIFFLEGGVGFCGGSASG